MRRRLLSFALRPVAAALLLGLATLEGNTQSLGPDFAGAYNIRDLGKVNGVEVGYGALIFKANDPATLLLGGDANDPGAKIYQAKVIRDPQNHITGFSGTALVFAAAPGFPPVQPSDISGGLDGGLDYGPNGVLFYTSYHDGGISQIKVGSSGPDKQVQMSALGLTGMGGGLLFVPAGFPGAGRLKIADFDAQWYDTTVSPDGAGTFNIVPPAQPLDIVYYGEGLAYVKAGKPGFAENSLLVASQLDDRVVAYEIDTNGDPLPGTLREFVTGFYQVKGATVDPVTGDFLFTTGDANNPRVLLIGSLSAASTDVHITAPGDGASFTAPATFPIYAEASQAGGAIARVDFYLGTKLCASVPESSSGAQFTTLADGLSGGAYTLTAVAIDGSGNATTSAPIHFSVVNNGPAITLTFPTNNAVLPACWDLALMANVQPGNSEIASVKFYDGLVGLATNQAPYNSQPYQCQALDLAEGTHMYSAVVTDINGLSSVAVATNVVVQPLPVNKLVLHHYVPNQLKFCFKGLPGSNYVWESTASLAEPAWTPFLTNSATSAKLQVTNQFDNHTPSGDYRTRWSN